jgi:hypothetical protein
MFFAPILHIFLRHTWVSEPETLGALLRRTNLTGETPERYSMGEDSLDGTTAK